MSVSAAMGRQTSVKVRMAPSFRPDSASVVRVLSRRAPAGTILELDFTGVRDCSQVALLMLACDVAAGAALTFRGLTAHQRRVLAYLGVQIEAPELDQD